MEGFDCPDRAALPQSGDSRPAYPLMAMLRAYLMQSWFGYGGPAIEEALYETTILRQFAGLGLGLGRIPDATAILQFPTYKKLGKRRARYKAKRKIEKGKARVCAKVEYPFRVVNGSSATSSALSVFGEKHSAVGHTVCVVEPVDSAPTLANECRSGAPVVRGMAAAVIATAKNTEISGV